MNRRKFLAALVAVPLAAALPAPARVEAPRLAFRKDAFSSIRFVQHFDVAAGPVVRMDVLYGFATTRPSYACVIGA